MGGEEFGDPLVTRKGVWAQARKDAGLGDFGVQLIPLSPSHGGGCCHNPGSWFPALLGRPECVLLPAALCMSLSPAG